jgi:hypothetical protein
MRHKTLTIGAGLIAALFAGLLSSTPLAHAQTLSEFALLALIEAGVDNQGQCKKVLSENLPNFGDINVKDKQVKQFIKAFCSGFSE